MSFILKKGKTRIVQYPFTASTALAKDSALEWTSGYQAAADDNDTDVSGVLVEDIAATDTDYAVTGKLKGVRIPVEKGVLWEADTADTYVQASHGGIYVGLANSTTVDLDDVTNSVFNVVGGSGTKVLGYFNIGRGY